MNGGTVTLDDCLSLRDGRLFIEERAAEELARTFGTPLYVVSEDQLRRNAQRYTAAFGGRWPGPFLLLPSIKANSVLALRRILTSEGAGCDAFGPGELEACLRTETPPDEVSLNGPMKDEALLERGIRAGVRVTLDSRAEFSRARAVAERIGIRASVRLRFRPDLRGRTEPSEMLPSGASVRDALQRYKAGIPTEDLVSIPREEIEDPNIDLTGIHLHLGRHSAAPEMWVEAVDGLADLLVHLRRAWGWEPREINLGGGFPVPRDPFGRTLPQRADAPDRSPGPDVYAEAVCARLADRLTSSGVAPENVRLEIEPGRGIYADAGVHLATIRNVKRQTSPMPLTWVETDSSDAYLPDVNLEFNRWTCIAATRGAADPSIVADVTGRTCALDVIVSDAHLPAVEPGDVVAFLDTGAYQDAGSSNFNALPRPGTALVTGDKAEMVRRHETLEDVFGRDSIPDRLAVAAGPDRVTDRRLDHVGICCSDLDRSLSFYGNLLGLALRDRGHAHGGDFEVTGIRDAKVRWADVELGGGQILELIEFLDPRGGTRTGRFNDTATAHISVRVEDADATHRLLDGANVPTVAPPRELTDPGPWQGAKVFYAKDPDGVAVEFIQRR